MRPTCTHIAIFAHDLDRAVDFYRRYAELKEVHRRVDGGVSVVWLAERGRETEFVIVLIAAEHAAPVTPAPLAHIGYSVESRAEVDRLARAARDDGILTEGPRDAGPIVGYYCILQDPDGNLVEFSHGQSLGPQA
jgi:catechol 2,3-dioxygenase-like lactoylglutathione lyase family enzyme